MLHVDFTQEAVEIASDMSARGLGRVAIFVTGARTRNADSVCREGARPLARTVSTSTRTRDPKTNMESLFYTSEIDIEEMGSYVITSSDHRGNDRVFRCSIEMVPLEQGEVSLRFRVGGSPAIWLCDDREPTRLLADEEFEFEFRATYEHNERTDTITHQETPRPSAWDRIDAIGEDDGK